MHWREEGWGKQKVSHVLCQFADHAFLFDCYFLIVWGDMLNNYGLPECRERKNHQVSWLTMCLFVHVVMFWLCAANTALFCYLNIKC